jgi:hypothetical protein
LQTACLDGDVALVERHGEWIVVANAKASAALRAKLASGFDAMVHDEDQAEAAPRQRPSANLQLSASSRTRTGGDVRCAEGGASSFRSAKPDSPRAAGMVALASG